MINGEISVRPEEFAAAVGWVAKWIQAKPAIPIQAGIAIEAGPGEITLTAYGENATARAKVSAESLSTATGRMIVSGRLLAALAATFGKRDPVTVTADGEGSVRLSAGRWSGTLPAFAEADWPTLPDALPEVGRVVGDDLATAVERVGAARGTDPKAGVMFMLMHLHFTGDRLELAATDRYRFALTSVPVDLAGNLPFDSLTPFAENMVEAAGAFAGPGHVTIGAEPGSLSLTGPRRQIVMRLGASDKPWPIDALHSYITSAMAQDGEVELAPDEIAMPLKRAGITGGRAGLARVRIEQDALLIGGAGEGVDGDEEVAVEYAGEKAEGFFNAGYFGAAFTSAPGRKVRIRFSTGGEQMRLPIIAYCEDDPHWRYITMPVRQL